MQAELQETGTKHRARPTGIQNKGCQDTADSREVLQYSSRKLARI